jgi:hypothetical protein
MTERWWADHGYAIANMLTGFLGVGLLKMRGIGGYAGWRWMFLIVG